MVYVVSSSINITSDTWGSLIVKIGVNMSDVREVVMAEEKLPKASFNPTGLGETIFKQRYARSDNESSDSCFSSRKR